MLRRGRDAFLGEAAGGVLGGEELADLAGRVLQRRLHGVPAVEHGQVVRPQALAAGALEALAPVALLMGGAGLGARARWLRPALGWVAAWRRRRFWPACGSIAHRRAASGP